MVVISCLAMVFYHVIICERTLDGDGSNRVSGYTNPFGRAASVPLGVCVAVRLLMVRSDGHFVPGPHWSN